MLLEMSTLAVEMELEWAVPRVFGIGHQSLLEKLEWAELTQLQY